MKAIRECLPLLALLLHCLVTLVKGIPDYNTSSKSTPKLATLAACPKSCGVWFDGCNFCPCSMGSFKCKTRADNISSSSCQASQIVAGTKLPYCYHWSSPPTGQDTEVEDQLLLDFEKHLDEPVQIPSWSTQSRGVCFLGCLQWQNGSSVCPCIAEGRIDEDQCQKLPSGIRSDLTTPKCTVELDYAADRTCPEDGAWPETLAGKTAYLTGHSGRKDLCENPDERPTRSRICRLRDAKWERETITCHPGYCHDDGPWKLTPVGTTVSLPCPGVSSVFRLRTCSEDKGWTEVDGSGCIPLEMMNVPIEGTPPGNYQRNQTTEIEQEEEIAIPASDPPKPLRSSHPQLDEITKKSDQAAEPSNLIKPPTWPNYQLYVLSAVLVSCIAAGYHFYNKRRKFKQEEAEREIFDYIMNENAGGHYLQF